MLVDYNQTMGTYRKLSEDKQGYMSPSSHIARKDIEQAIARGEQVRVQIVHSTGGVEIISWADHLKSKVIPTVTPQKKSPADPRRVLLDPPDRAYRDVDTPIPSGEFWPKDQEEKPEPRTVQWPPDEAYR